MRVHFVVLALVFLHGSARGARLGTAGLQTIAADSGPLSNQQGGPVVQQELLKAAGLFDDRGTWAGLEEDLQHIVIMVEQQVQVLQACPCDCDELCDRITTHYEKEFFGFMYPTTKNFRLYDWSHLTAVAWQEDPELLCLAHSHGARVIKNAGDVTATLTNRTAALDWVVHTVRHVIENRLDGVNFDWEAPAAPGSPQACGYSRLVALTAGALRLLAPGAQVSVDVPWSPFDVDGRNFEWPALALAADLLFVMAYDMQSQIWGRCVAAANDPLALVERGLKQWLDMGIPANKLVLGVPWYGYDYPCYAASNSKDGHVPPDVDVCTLAVVPFTGAPCSDAAGSQRPYAEIMQLLRSGVNTTAVTVDPLTLAPYFNYQSQDDGRVHQVWFDDPQALLHRYKLARSLGLRGVGCWNLEWLYHPTPLSATQKEIQAMWDAVAHGFFKS